MLAAISVMCPARGKGESFLKGMNRSRCLLFAVALCGFIAMAAVAQTPDSSSSSRALLEDAASYAKETGVSLDEAVRRLRLQTEVGRLDEMLATQEAESFAGLWIEHEPKFRVVVRFQDPAAEGRLRARVAGTPLEGLVETRQAAVSLAQLEKRRDAAVQRARRLGFAVDSDINVQDNRVEIQSDRAQSLRAAIAAERANLPERVEILTVPGLAKPSVLRGGDGDPDTARWVHRPPYLLQLRRDLHGRALRQLSDLPGAAAAICGRSLLRLGRRAVAHRLGYTDVTNEFNSGLGYRAVVGTRGRADQTVGSYVCKWGTTTGRTCGYIQSRHAEPSYVPNSDDTFVRVNGYGAVLSAPGDSGGPWFLENVAYGINSGAYSDGDAIYMPINYIDRLGVSVLTYNPGPGCGAPPVASFYYRASTTFVDFNASGSYDPDGSIISYSWDFGDATTGSGVTVSHIYPYEGNFLVTLTVTDNSGKTGQSAQYVNASSDPCGGDPCCGDPRRGTYCCGNPYCWEP